MKNVFPAYRIFPIGDGSLTVDFGNVIDEELNKWVIRLFNELKKDPLPGMIESVPAYSSLTIYYDLFQLRKLASGDKTVYEWLAARLEEKLKQPQTFNDENPQLVKVPVCYDMAFAPDLQHVAAVNKIATEEVIRLHYSKTYRVYMLGFLPGFTYMGEVDDRIAVPRKSGPQPVAAGSIGIAGKQTGIYPLASPGGWHIIGRTNLKLFNPGLENPTLLREGDLVQFIPISKDEFENN